jgi:hypothetical protein
MKILQPATSVLLGIGLGNIISYYLSEPRDYVQNILYFVSEFWVGIAVALAIWYWNRRTI